MATADAPPMIATLVVEYTDGTTAVFASGTEWKTAIHAAEGWQQKGFDDSGWKTASPVPQVPPVKPVEPGMGKLQQFVPAGQTNLTQILPVLQSGPTP